MGRQISYRRSKALEQVAFRLGLDFRQKDPYDFFRLLQDFDLCKDKSFKKARNIISQIDPWGQEEISIFDYHFIPSISAHFKSDFKEGPQTVFFANSKHLSLPEFSIRPRVNNKSDKSSVNFAHYPNFHRQYEVLGSDIIFIRKVVNQLILRFFSYEDGWTIESMNFLLLIYKEGQLIEPQMIDEFHEMCMEIYYRFKIPIK